jgi:hypothetical protein
VIPKSGIRFSEKITPQPRGDNAMNVQFRDRPEQASSVHAKTAIAD